MSKGLEKEIVQYLEGKGTEITDWEKFKGIYLSTSGITSESFDENFQNLVEKGVLVYDGEKGIYYLNGVGNNNGSNPKTR